MGGFGIAGGLLGGFMSGIGASEAAKAKNKAGQNALDQYITQTDYGKVLQAYETLGSDAPAWLKANLPTDQYQRIFGSPDFKQEVTKAPPPNNQTGGGMFAVANRNQANQQNQTQYRTVAGQKPTLDINALNAEYGNSKGTLGQISDLSNQGLTQLQGIQSQYARDTGALARQGQQALSTAQQFGKGRADIINRDMNQQQQNALQSSQANLIASGLGGSSLLGNNQAQIGRQFGFAKQSALQQLSDSQLQAQLGVQQNNLGVASQRAAGGTALGQQSLAQGQSLGLAPIQARQQAFSGAAFNPFLGMNTTQFYPGMSPGGSFLVSAGNSLSGMGGTMYGQSGGGAGSGAGMSNQFGGSQQNQMLQSFGGY